MADSWKLGSVPGLVKVRSHSSMSSHARVSAAQTARMAASESSRHERHALSSVDHSRQDLVYFQFTTFIVEVGTFSDWLDPFFPLMFLVLFLFSHVCACVVLL